MTDAGDRGSLTIEPKVVERVAEIAAGKVSGTSSSSSTISHMLGRSYPRIDAEVAGGRAVLDVEVAAVWPTPLPELAQSVARSVRKQVLRIAGIKVDRINVLIGQVVNEKPVVESRVQ